MKFLDCLLKCLLWLGFTYLFVAIPSGFDAFAWKDAVLAYGFLSIIGWVVIILHHYQDEINP